MRIIIATGEDEDLINMVIPRNFWTNNRRPFRKRMKWIISLMEKDSGRKIETLA